MPGTVIAADALGGVGEALQRDAAAQLQTFPPVGKELPALMYPLSNAIRL